MDVESCALRHVMQRVRDAVADMLEGCSIRDLQELGEARDLLSK